MELKLGKMTNKDIAEWMGISAITFNGHKEKYLKELENNYFKYHLEGKRVYIDEIYNPVFKKGVKPYQMVKEKIDDIWSKNGLDSCKNVSEQIVEYYGDKLEIKPSTAYKYTTRGRNDLYGKPFGGEGEIGSCEYVWCKKTDNGYELLSEEEEKIKKNLIKKYFGNADEKQILVAGMVESGEITKEEAWEVLSELTNMKGNNFILFLGELQDKLDCQIVKGTLVTRNQIKICGIGIK